MEPLSLDTGHRYSIARLGDYDLFWPSWEEITAESFEPAIRQYLETHKDVDDGEVLLVKNENGGGAGLFKVTREVVVGIERVTP